MTPRRSLATLALALASIGYLPPVVAQPHAAPHPHPHAPPHAEADAGVAGTTLGATLAHASSVHVAGSGPGAAPGGGDVTDAPQLAAIVAALGAAQVPTSAMSRCMTPVALQFRDAAQTTIATVGLCDAPGLAPANRSEARIDVPGAAPRGLNVQNLAALRIALRTVGIELP